MKRRCFQNDLRAYLDEELGGGRNALVKKHLSECQECARKLASMSHVMGLAKQIQSEEPPAYIVEGVMQRLEQERQILSDLDGSAGGPAGPFTKGAPLNKVSLARRQFKLAAGIAAALLMAVAAYCLYAWPAAPDPLKRITSIRESLASLQAEIKSIYPAELNTSINPELLDNLEKSRAELEICEQSIEALKVRVLNRIGRIYEAKGEYEMALAAYRRISETTTYPEAMEIMNRSRPTQSDASKRRRQGASIHGVTPRTPGASARSTGNAQTATIELACASSAAVRRCPPIASEVRR